MARVKEYPCKTITCQGWLLGSKPNSRSHKLLNKSLRRIHYLLSMNKNCQLDDFMEKICQDIEQSILGRKRIDAIFRNFFDYHLS